MELTRGKLKKIIKEEIQRMTELDDGAQGRELASNLISEFKTLSASDQQIFLNHFIGFLNEKKAWLYLINHI